MNIQQALTITSQPVGETAKPTINARDLHTWLESKQDFSNWISNRIKQYGFEENIDYVVFNKIIENPQSPENKGGRPRKDYHITFDMAKELGMVERNDKGREARRYFIACEQRLIRHLSQQKPDNSVSNAHITSLMRTLKDTIEGQNRIMHRMISMQRQSLDLQAQMMGVLEKQTSRRRYRPATNEDYFKVKDMLKANKSFDYISEALGISKGSIHGIKHGLLHLGNAGMLERVTINTTRTNININA